MNSDIFEHTVDDYIRRHNLLPQAGKVIVALSGGADSVALLTVLVRLGFDCTAAHCNFHLRGAESNRDCAFARSVADSLHTAYREIHFDVNTYRAEHGVSVEMACRDLRYNWFATLSESLSDNGERLPIAVAHHLDDNIETLMLNLLRGSGTAGLRGMLPKTDRGVIRPFMDVTRAQILDYLRQLGLSYVTDSSNLENDVKRNRLRNIILPEIYRQFPDSRAGIAATISNMAATELLLADHISRSRAEMCHTSSDYTVEVSLDRVCSESSAPACLLFELLKPCGFNISQCNNILQARNTSGNRFLTSTHEAITAGGQLIVSPLSVVPSSAIVINNPLAEKLPDGFRIRLVPVSEIRFTRDTCRVYLSTEIISRNLPLTFRHWSHADRMRPYGMKGSRLVSDIFSDNHLNLKQKQKAWIVECDGKIVWIPGLRTSAYFTVGSGELDAVEISAEAENCV